MPSVVVWPGTHQTHRPSRARLEVCNAFGVGVILAVNAGSTGVKLHLVDDREGVTVVRSLDAMPHGLEAVGHRIVHGGPDLTAPVVIDDRVAAELEEAGALAPLHSGPALHLVEEARVRLPGVRHVAVFDTGFHAGMPDEATTYALSSAWREAGVRRYGFHGLSAGWAAARAQELLGRPVAGLRLVVCHLGGGASATAVRDGRSIDTTMGLTPLEGLVMATRAGSIDPAAPLHMIIRRGLSPEEAERQLEEESGLLGLCGTADMRQVESRAEAGDAQARRALAVYDHRLAAGVAAMTASLGGLDALVFTGGVGEGSARVRTAAVARLAFLGVALDEVRNRAVDGDTDLSAPGARVGTLVVRSREELAIARAVRGILTADQSDEEGR
jgi:acetate kinase